LESVPSIISTVPGDVTVNANALDKGLANNSKPALAVTPFSQELWFTPLLQKFASSCFRFPDFLIYVLYFVPFTNSYIYLRHQHCPPYWNHPKGIVFTLFAQIIPEFEFPFYIMSLSSP